VAVTVIGTVAAGQPILSEENIIGEVLYYVNEMSAPEGFDSIQDLIDGTEIDVVIDENAARADLAIQVWMKDRDLIERLHAEQFLLRPRSFEYFRVTNGFIPEFKEPSEETVHALEADLDEWFSKKRRGRASKVFVYVKPDFVWFLVCHGEPFTRESIIKDGKSSSVYPARPLLWSSGISTLTGGRNFRDFTDATSY